MELQEVFRVASAIAVPVPLLFRIHIGARMLSLHHPTRFVPPGTPASHNDPSHPVVMTEATGGLVARMRPGANAQVDRALMDLCEAVQLPEPARKTAEGAYGSIAKFLMAEVPSLSNRPAQAYPQGSILQKTTVKPLRRDLFDVDIVMELPWQPKDPVSFMEETHQLVLLWVKRHGGEFGASSAVMKDRCIEIGFTSQIFSMDVVPACFAGTADSDTRINIVDAGRASWKLSDPKAFAAWFEVRTRVIEHLPLKEGAFAKSARAGVVHPMPEDDDPADKAPLRLVIQLAKRARDVFHRRDGEEESHAVPSILLTVLVARSYRGTRNLSAALRDAASDLAAFAAPARPQKLVNPANPGEAITDKWDRCPESWESFRRWANAFLMEVDAVIAAPDAKSLHKALSMTFGDAAATEAVKIAAQRVGKHLDQGQQRVSPTGKVLAMGSAPTAAAVTAPPTTYFGA